MSPLAAKAARLPMREFLQVWDAASDAEKAELLHLMTEKKRAYFRTAYNRGPQWLATDKTYKRLAEMFAEGVPDLSAAPRSPFGSAFAPSAAPGLTPLPQ